MEDAIGVAAIKWHGRTGYDLASLTLTGLLEVHPEHWTGPRNDGSMFTRRVSPQLGTPVIKEMPPKFVNR